MFKKMKKEDVFAIEVGNVKGLRGNREDAECLKIEVQVKHDDSNVMTLVSIYFMAIHAQESDLKSKVSILYHQF